jgi:signal transduction histidine kinase
MAQPGLATSPGPARPAASSATETDLWLGSADARRYARERRLARDLIELSRLERGVEHAEHAPVDLARLVGAVRADYPTLVVDGTDTLIVQTDSRRLARILFAVLDNAFLHGAEPVRLHYDSAAIVVSDAGRGFAARVLGHATEPFVAGRRAWPSGAGLGLAIAARQAALLEAALELANAPEGGARVTLQFGARTPL